MDLERHAGSVPPTVKLDLNRVMFLLKRLGNPHFDVPAIHVAGTKGKGSTCAMVTGVLSNSGYKVGLFTSPHLHTFLERISVNGKPITKEEFSFLVESVKPHIEEVAKFGRYGFITLFEALTAMAFLHFKNIGADFQVLEVGLGGRLDSTNVIYPLVSGITSISLDHTAILGDSVEKIAIEKAGIIKHKIPVVCAPQEDGVLQVIKQKAADADAELTVIGQDLEWTGLESNYEGQRFALAGRLMRYDLWIPLLGRHQLENASVAIGIIEALIGQGWNIPFKNVAAGISSVSWPCRMEILSREPMIMVDGAHNPYSLRRLTHSLLEMVDRKRVIVIFGVSSDKNIDGMIDELKILDPIIIITNSRQPRAMEVNSLASMFNKKGVRVHVADNAWDAVKMSEKLSGKDDILVATGSLFVAAEVREIIKGIDPELYYDFVKSHK